jgi:hypothetical protein
MMANAERKLSLDQPAHYQIRVPGHLDKTWFDWAEGMTVRVERDPDSSPFTTLTGCLDQAALQGLLRRLYSLGLPLVSVICLECGRETGSCACQNEEEGEKI